MMKTGRPRSILNNNYFLLFWEFKRPLMSHVKLHDNRLTSHISIMQLCVSARVWMTRIMIDMFAASREVEVILARACCLHTDFSFICELIESLSLYLLDLKRLSSLAARDCSDRRSSGGGF